MKGYFLTAEELRTFKATGLLPDRKPDTDIPLEEILSGATAPTPQGDVARITALAKRTLAGSNEGTEAVRHRARETFRELVEATVALKGDKGAILKAAYAVLEESLTDLWACGYSIALLDAAEERAEITAEMATIRTNATMAKAGCDCPTCKPGAKTGTSN